MLAMNMLLYTTRLFHPPREFRPAALRGRQLSYSQFCMTTCKGSMQTGENAACPMCVAIQLQALHGLSYKLRAAGLLQHSHKTLGTHIMGHVQRHLHALCCVLAPSCIHLVVHGAPTGSSSCAVMYQAVISGRDHVTSVSS